MFLEATIPEKFPIFLLLKHLSVVTILFYDEIQELILSTCVSFNIHASAYQYI